MASTLAVVLSFWRAGWRLPWSPGSHHTPHNRFITAILSLSLLTTCALKRTSFLSYFLLFLIFFQFFYYLYSRQNHPFSIPFPCLQYKYIHSSCASNVIIFLLQSVYRVYIPIVIEQINQNIKRNCHLFVIIIILCASQEINCIQNSLQSMTTRRVVVAHSPTLRRTAASRPIRPVPMRLLLSLREE